VGLMKEILSAPQPQGFLHKADSPCQVKETRVAIPVYRKMFLHIGILCLL
jgi:hypothetical protein